MCWALVKSLDLITSSLCFFFPLQQSKWLDADWCGRRIDCWRAIQNVSSVTDPSLSLRRKGVGSKSWSVADLYLFACFLLAFSLSADFASGFTDGHSRWFRLIHAVYAHNKLAAKKPWTRVALSCIWIHLALFFPSPPVLCLTFSSFFLVLLLVRRSYMDVRLHPRRISSGIFLVLFALLLLFRLRLSTSSLFSDFNWHTHTHTQTLKKYPPVHHGFLIRNSCQMILQHLDRREEKIDLERTYADSIRKTLAQER